MFSYSTLLQRYWEPQEKDKRRNNHSAKSYDLLRLAVLTKYLSKQHLIVMSEKSVYMDNDDHELAQNVRKKL